MIKDVRKIVRAEKLHDLDSLGDELTACFTAARRVLANNCFSQNEAAELAKYLETIRMLLQELEHATYSRVNAADQTTTISGLRNDFLELEGTVKELRNDLNGRAGNI